MTTSSARVWGVLESLEIPEGVRAELIFGEILLSLSSDLTTNLIVESLIHQIPAERWHRWTRQDVSCGGGGSRLQPDLVVFERGAAEATVPVATVEVVTKTSALCDYRTKRELYAEGTIPVYLIVDPIKAVCVLLTEPTRSGASGLPDYVSERTTKFGEPIPVDLLGITLDTSEFQTYA